MASQFWWVLAVAVSLVMTLCEAALEEAVLRQIDSLVQAGMTCRGIPGLSLAVIKGGQVQVSKGYGVKDVVTKQPVTADTMFQLASVTKGFTAALLANVLAGNSHLRLSSSLHTSHILPSDFVFNNTLRTTYATFEDLLAHRTGIPRNNYIRLGNDYSIDTIADKVRYLPTAGSFRDSFYYNDLMYCLAAHLTELLGKDKWEQQIRDVIFTPLGMSNSSFISQIDFSTDDVAMPYTKEHGHLVKPSFDFIKHYGKNTGSGSIFSSANDMARWMKMLLNDGKSASGSDVLRDGVVTQVFNPSNVIILSSASVDRRRPTMPVSYSSDTYALGWRRGYYRGYQMNYHSGSTFGYKAYISLLPEMEIGVVTLMSGLDTDYKFRLPLHEYLMDVALGAAPFINISSICTYPDPWKSARAHQTGSHEESMNFDDEEGDEELTPHNLASRDAPRSGRASLDLTAYTGVFHHGAYGDLEVLLNSSRSTLQLRYGIGLWDLTPEADGLNFRGQWLKGPPTLNKNFLFHSLHGHINSVQALGFDSSKPPVFFRKAGGGFGIIG